VLVLMAEVRRHGGTEVVGLRATFEVLKKVLCGGGKALCAFDVRAKYMEVCHVMHGRCDTASINTNTTRSTKQHIYTSIRIDATA
jgi:hypothetical protein